jgi:hypothetical protein
MNPVEVVSEGHGPTGLPNKMVLLRGEMAEPGRALDYLRGQGCGAWKGRAQCGEKVDETVTVGWAQLLFSTYLTAGPFVLPGGERASIAFVCSDHAGDNMTKDMPRALRRSQAKERDRWIALGGRKEWYGI